ncbi:hypothetical protein SteCoe_8724 [Stentor coeruleus]|uniref:Uncharacterized protein n=1 Tax=Stentor coeruleus TaxID=5963 RepID=A0A1R2CJP5_9CILI|nr:hypothetical protein SteCoe_8724 [Stentor coeruleus]
MNKYSHRSTYLKYVASEKYFPVLKPTNSPFKCSEVVLTERRGSTSSLTSKQQDGQSIYSIKPSEFIYRSASIDLQSKGLLYETSKDTERQSSISRFTMIQNDVITNSLQKYHTDKEPSVYIPSIDNRKHMKRESDFMKLINKLDRVISPNRGKRPIFLQDGDPIEVIVEENQMQYCKIYVKGKRTPMSVKMQRIRGKIIAYMSITEKEPGPNSYDRIFSTDYFEIRENSSVFKYDNIYLGLKSSEDSEVIISLSFGKIVDLLEIKRIRRQLSQHVIPKEILKDEGLISIKDKKYSKNFIKLNKNITFLNSYLNAEDLQKRAESWKAKHEQIISKKKVILSQKVNKNKQFVNKQIIKLQLEKEEKEKRKISKVKRALESQWLMIMYFYISAETIYSGVKKLKRQKLKKITWNMKAYQIQKAIRKKGKLNLGDKILIRVQNLLLLYKDCIGKHEKRIMTKHMIENISFLAHNHLLSHQFHNYIARVLYVQRQVKIYLAKRNRRMLHLAKLWNEECRNYLFKKSSNKTARKKNSVNIVTISNAKRSAIINDYYHECIVRYRLMIRSYITSMQNLQIRRSFSNSVFLKRAKPIPQFEYLPTREAMEVMIEKAVKNSLLAI